MVVKNVSAVPVEILSGMKPSHLGRHHKLNLGSDELGVKLDR